MNQSQPSISSPCSSLAPSRSVASGSTAGTSPPLGRRRSKASASRPTLATAQLAALARSLRPERGGLDLAQRNRTGLEALAQCSDPATRMVLRNALVHQNLPLVGAIASRLGRSQGLPQEDLYQIASLGLLRAIEAFRPERGRSLSSFAVPYIRGAIQHELRDRSSLVRIPRELWELRRQVTVLQESQRHQGGVALAAPQLAAALGCRVDRVVEALSLHTVTEMASLDAPLRSSEEAACGSSLLESLADPASLAASDAEGPEGCTSAEAGWRSAAALAHGQKAPRPDQTTMAVRTLRPQPAGLPRPPQPSHPAARISAAPTWPGCVSAWRSCNPSSGSCWWVTSAWAAAG